MRSLHTLSLASLAVMIGMRSLAQCPGGTEEVVLFTSDFEANDGGLVVGGGMDWEWGTIQTVLLDTADCSGLFVHPPGAYSGTKGWGSELNGCYDPLGAESSLTLTVDLSSPGFTSARMDWHEWYNVFVAFDYLTIYANNTPIYFNDSIQDTFTWQARTVDLSPFLGSQVDIRFALFATTVVNLAGWYLDDIVVTACDDGSFAIGENGTALPSLWFDQHQALLQVKLAGTPDPRARIEVYDGLGRVVHGSAVQGDTGIRLSQLRAGAYTGVYRDGSGTPRVRVRFVVP